MNRTDRSRHTLIAAVVTLVLVTVPVVGAVPTGAFTAEEALFDAGNETGALAMAWLRGDGVNLDGVRIHAEAGTVQAVQYERETPFLRIPASAAGLPDIELQVPTPEAFTGQDVQETSFDATDAGLELVDQGRTLRVTIREASPEALRLDAGLGGFIARPIQDPHVDGEGITAGRPNNSAGEPPADTFSPTLLEGPFVRTTGSDLGFRFTLVGDLILETQEADFRLESEDGQQTMRSRVSHEPLHDDVPQESTDAAYVSTDRFLRIHLQDARVEVSVPYFHGALDWVLYDAVVEPMGHATFMDARGRLVDGGQVQELGGERLEIDTAGQVHMAAADDGLAIEMAHAGPRSTAVAPPEALRAPWIIAAAVAVVASIAVAGWGARAARLPTMASIEADIEAGHYARAARRARRILRRHPVHEGAAVARAVALSRAGRHHVLVHEVEDRLAEQGAGDGVLHYLLGRSYDKLDRPGEALKAFEEAVHKTPSLAGEVDQLVGRRNKVAKRPSQGYT